jgi:hypothetical protein
MKRKAKFNLGMPIPVKLQRTGEIVTAMTGNVNFTTPNPDLAVVETARSELAAAHQTALDGGKSAKADQRTKNLALNELLRPLRDYVNEIAVGDEDIVLSSGFEASKVPQSIGKMPQVANLEIISGDGDGSVTLKWRVVYGASTYQIQISDDGVTYKPQTSTTRSRNNVVENLIMAKYYYFRVAAVGAAGRGPWSDSYKVLVS